MTEIFANDMSEKGLIFKICKQFIQFNVKKKKNNLTKNRHFFKESIWMSNRHIKNAHYH